MDAPRDAARAEQGPRRATPGYGWRCMALGTLSILLKGHDLWTLGGPAAPRPGGLLASRPAGPESCQHGAFSYMQGPAVHHRGNFLGTAASPWPASHRGQRRDAARTTRTDSPRAPYEKWTQLKNLT